MDTSMIARERIDAVLAGKTPDRTPLLGGWIACPQHICSLTKIDIDTYWSDPVLHSISAYRALGVDGLVGLFVPRNRGDYRNVDADSYLKSATEMNLDDALSYIEDLPVAADIIDKFDLDSEYTLFSRELQEKQSQCKDIVWFPPQWDLAAKASWYDVLGYENYFVIVGMYPDHAKKLMEVGGARGYCRSLVLARAVADRKYPKAVLFGEDICTQRGPMVSPEFLRAHFAPYLRRGLEPLLEVGCSPIWHSDGDIRQIMEMLIDCGVQGFQGFQPECGMHIEEIVKLRTREGRKLIIFGPLSVTEELPRMTAGDVRDRVREVIQLCADSAHLLLFTANTINPDVPLENIVAMYEAATECVFADTGGK